jgi:hypothetical protein
MVGGFANTAGSVLAAYVGMLHNFFPDIAGHLIAQSVMSAPAALVCAKIVMPEMGKPLTSGENVRMPKENLDANALDAAARGASEGMALAFNVGAMLLAFIGLIALANAILTKVSVLVGGPALTIERLLGFVGVPFRVADGRAAARLLGGGQADRRQDGRERVRGLPAAGRPAQDGQRAVIPVGRHRLVRAVGVLELLVDRDPDRRHLGHRADAAP